MRVHFKKLFITWIILVTLASFALSQTINIEKRPGLIKMPDIEYTAYSLRDPFISQWPVLEEEIKPEEQVPEEKEEIKIIKPKPSELFTFSIQGIIWNPDTPIAIINNQVLKRGDEIPVPQGRIDTAEKVKIVDIEKDGVIVVYSDVREKLLSPAASELKKIEGGKE